MKKNLVFGLIIVCVFTLLSCQSTKVNTVNEATCEISVSGSGVITVEPDMVSFSIGVSEIADTTSEAQQLANKKISAILSILRNHNVETKDIQTSSLNIYTEYNYQDNKRIKVGERVSQNVNVTLKNVEDFGSVIDGLGANVSGIELNSIYYSKQEKDELYEQARVKAIEDAYSKAHAYAQASGLETIKAVSISEGGFSTSRTSANTYGLAKAAAMVPEVDAVSSDSELPTGTIEVRVSVSVVFLAK